GAADDRPGAATGRTDDHAIDAATGAATEPARRLAMGIAAGAGVADASPRRTRSCDAAATRPAELTSAAAVATVGQMRNAGLPAIVRYGRSRFFTRSRLARKRAVGCRWLRRVTNGE